MIRIIIVLVKHHPAQFIDDLPCLLSKKILENQSKEVNCSVCFPACHPDEIKPASTSQPESWLQVFFMSGKIQD